MTSLCKSCLLAAARLSASLSVLLTMPAMADDTGFYVGANLGRVLSTYRRADLDNGVTSAFSAVGNGFAIGPSSARKDHVMWSADVGYMMTRNFGIEASYLYLGSLRYSAFGTTSVLGTETLVNANVDIKSRGPALAAIASLPMSNVWEIDARIGAYEGKTISTYLSALGTDSISGRESKTSTSLLAGLGTSVTLTSHCVARLDYIRVEHIDEPVFEHSFNVDLLTVGLAYVF